MKYCDYALDLGFTKNKNIYVMEHNGFKIYLKDFQYMVLSIPSFYIPLNQPLDKNMIKDLQFEALNNACAAVSLGSAMDTLVVTLPEGNKTKDKTKDTIKEMIENVTAYLKDNNFGPMEKCPVCKEDGEYQAFGLNYCPMHQECRNKYLEALKEKVNENKGFNIKYVLAILFVLLGIGIGLIAPILLTIYLHDYFTGVLALIPILSTLGLWLSHAPNKKWLKITVGALVFVSVITFLCISIPYMASFTEEKDLFSYMFKNGWPGFRKALFGGILAFGGFGGAKFLDKFKKDYSKELEALKENEDE